MERHKKIHKILNTKDNTRFVAILLNEEQFNFCADKKGTRILELKLLEKTNIDDDTYPAEYELILEEPQFVVLPYSTAIGKKIEFPVHVLSEDKYIYTVLVNGDVTIHGLKIPSMSKVELCKVHFTVKEIEQ